MYNSLVPWSRFPVYVQAYTNTAASGDKVYAAAKEYRCYPVENYAEIIDKYGERYISRTQLYMPSDVPITPEDLVSLDSVLAYEIRKIGGFYDGNTGSLDIYVVYL